MIKAGIITIHDIYNYGSVLQAYATQVLLENIGVAVEIIDYKYPNQFHQQEMGRSAKLLQWVNIIFKSLLPGNPYRKYKDRYQEFKLAHYKLSKVKYYSYTLLQEKPPEYDLYVAGSDQIWRPSTMKGDSHFFLNFTPAGKKKIAFGSSFGCRSIPEEYKKQYADWLSCFSAIGVRERIGVDIVKQLSGLQATLVLDPTLLLTKEEWKKIQKPISATKPYILCYGLNFKHHYMEKLALHIQKYTGWEIVRINGKAYDYFNRKMTYVLDAGPAEWLSYFSGAEFILAQSFHATVFAIIMERNFLSILKGNDDHDSRQKNILKLLNLENRAICFGDAFPDAEKIKKMIDFDEIREKLKVERDRSLAFLKDAVCAK